VGGGGKGIASVKKSRLDTVGDSDVMETTGDWSLSTALCIEGKIVCCKMAEN
jgi:hypothetical protein